MGTLDPALREEFGDAVAERFAAPAHAGAPADAAGWVSAEAGRVGSGAVVVFWLRGDATRIEQARFEAFADPAVVAAAEWACERAEGAAPGELAGMEGRRIADILALPVARVGGVLLVEDALRAALCRLAPA